MLRSETAAFPERAAKTLAGLHAYQHAKRPDSMANLPGGASVGRATLRDYGGTGRAVVFIPSLINPPDILDLSPDTSLLRWLASRGVRPLLVDWGTPGPADQTMTLADHVETLLLPMLRTLPQPPVLVGYCLGGTLAVAAAVRAPVAGLATIAAPWHFDGYGTEGRAALARTWALAAPLSKQLGVLPMEVLQAGFWQLDPARTIAKYEAFADLAPDSAEAAAFVRLEDWANAGAPIPHAAAAGLFEDCIAQDRPGRGEWQVGGMTIDPANLTCPAVEFVATGDRIVPAATAIGLPDRRDVAAGHVGMIIGRRARRDLWEPLADWIAALP